MKKFSIIIPTLNEADNIIPLLRQIAAVTRPLGLSPETIFVDDGSTDATRQYIDTYSGDLDIHLVRRDSQTGLAGAVVAGARAASHPHVVVMDADLSHPPQMIPALLEPLAAGTYDMVIGSRYQGDGGTPGWPLVRRLGSQLASLPARLLTSVRDPLSGFFATDRDRLRVLPDNMPGFKVGLELLSQTAEVRPLGGYLSFLLVVILGLFLRGGQFASSVASNEFSSFFVPYIIGATSCLTWLTAIIASRLGTRRPQGVNWKIFGSLLIGYTILLRLVYLGNFDLIQEEAYYWNYAQHLATGYLDHPPVVALLIKFGTLLFGQNELGVRFGAFICWFVTAFFTYQLTKIIFNKDSGIRALVLVATLPIFFGVAVVMTPDAPLIACWAGALYFLYRALVFPRRLNWTGPLWLAPLGRRYELLQNCQWACLLPCQIPSGRPEKSAKKCYHRISPLGVKSPAVSSATTKPCLNISGVSRRVQRWRSTLFVQLSNHPDCRNL